MSWTSAPRVADPPGEFDRHGRIDATVRDSVERDESCAQTSCRRTSRSSACSTSDGQGARETHRARNIVGRVFRIELL